MRFKIEIQYSGNDGCFKYWVSEWNNTEMKYEKTRMFDNFTDFKKYIMEEST